MISNEYPNDFGEDRDLLWKQYEKLVDLHKFYLELLIKSAAIVNVLVSGLTAFIFSDTESFQAKLLWLPSALSLMFAFILIIAAPKCSELRHKTRILVDKLELGIGPHVSLTQHAAIGFALFYLMSAIIFFFLPLTSLLKGIGA